MTVPVHVAVGVIRGDKGSVLLALRAHDSHQGGLWEFPGGKVEAGETVTQALARELQEELGITVNTRSPLCKISHDYGDKKVVLDVWSVDSFTGEPEGRQGQPLRWVACQELQMQDFPAANRPIIRRLQLPDMIAITAQESDDQIFSQRFEQILAQGVNMIQLRAPELSTDEYRMRALRCAELCRIYNGRLLLNAEPELVAETGADGFHANSQRLMNLRTRPVAEDIFFSASCHNKEQLLHAENIGVDFALVSPVLATHSHPDSPELGWNAFAALAKSVDTACYALGGMNEDHLQQAKSHGGIGFAAISAFWR